MAEGSGEGIPLAYIPNPGEILFILYFVIISAYSGRQMK